VSADGRDWAEARTGSCGGQSAFEEPGSLGGGDRRPPTLPPRTKGES
jgi:hypothetical protein